MSVPRQVTPGAPHDGIVRYARLIAAAVGAGPRTSIPAGGDAALAGAGLLHLHFTDRVWGPTPEAAAARVERLAAVAPLSVTLHDVPQASDGPAMARRAAAYARVVGAARGSVVNSRHERALLRATLGQSFAPAVIPLPIDVLPAVPRPQPDEEVVVLGFVYPGKGHAEVLEAVAALGPGGPGVTALGGASDGHADELHRLEARAARLGVRFTTTGHVDDAELIARARRAAVPVAAHRHVSASGSVATWIGAGRRPLVADGDYTREMAGLRPGTLTVVTPSQLPAAIARALRDPASTWWDASATLAPRLADAAAAYRAWWHRLP